MKKNNKIWHPVKGYEGFYEVSSNGDVRSVDRIIHATNRDIHYKGRILKGSISPQGYLKVVLQVNRINKIFPVHRLVAEAFIPNPLGLPMINHKDENKLNNNYVNLEFCDCKYNVNYGTANIRRGIKMKEVQKKHIFGVDVFGNSKTFDSLLEAAKSVNGFSSNICKCLKNQIKSAYGYKWYYV